MTDGTRFPPALTSLRQWVNWEPATKAPKPKIDGKLLTYALVSGHDPDHVGFVFTEDDPFAGIDIDDMTPLAAELLQEARRLGAYVECSPSGDGWHIIGHGSLPRNIGSTKQGPLAGLEAYDHGRYFTMTGKRASGSPGRSIQPLLDRMWAAKFNGGGDNVVTPTGGGHWDAAEHLSLLAHISPDCGYGDWVAVGQALRAADAPFVTWDSWSRASEKYPGEDVCLRKWESFKGEGRGIGTLYEIAREHGWQESAEELFDDVPEAPEPKLTVWERHAVDARTLTGEPPQRTWAWDQWVPHGVVTGLAGPPGVAKSTFALQLCVHHCLGAALLGADVDPGPAAFITVEDDPAELHRRYHRICDGLLEDPEAVEGLFLLSIMEDETSLLGVSRDGRLLRRTRLRHLEDFIESRGIRLLVLDLVGDFWEGSEVVRAEVTQFVRGTLGRLASKTGCAVLAVAHLNKQGERSGSTAWAGSFRSGFRMVRDEDRDVVEVERDKHNYAGPSGVHTLRWTDGYMVLVPPEEAEHEAEQALDEEVLAVASFDVAKSAYTLAQELGMLGAGRRPLVDAAVGRLLEAGLLVEAGRRVHTEAMRYLKSFQN